MHFRCVPNNYCYGVILLFKERDDALQPDMYHAIRPTFLIVFDPVTVLQHFLHGLHYCLLLITIDLQYGFKNTEFAVAF